MKSFDDICIRPAYTTIDKRDISLRTMLSKRYAMNIPFVTVGESELAVEMMELGGCCAVYAQDRDEQVNQVNAVYRAADIEMSEKWGVMIDDWPADIRHIPVAAMVMVSEFDGGLAEHACRLTEAGANVLFVLMDHGDCDEMFDILTELNVALPDHVDVLAGQVATPEAKNRLESWGAAGVLIGAPEITNLSDPDTISDCVWNSSSDLPSLSYVNSIDPNDAAKALMLGSDTVAMFPVISADVKLAADVLREAMYITNSTDLSKFWVR